MNQLDQHFISEFGNVGDFIHDRSSMIVIDRIHRFYVGLFNISDNDHAILRDCDADMMVRRLVEYSKTLNDTHIRTLNPPETSPNVSLNIGDIRITDFFTEEQMRTNQLTLSSEAIIGELATSLYSILTGNEFGEPEATQEARLINHEQASQTINYLLTLFELERDNKATYCIYGDEHPLRAFEDFPNQVGAITDASEAWTVIPINEHTPFSEILDKAAQSRILHIHIRANDDNELIISQQLMGLLVHLPILTNRFNVEVRIYVDGEPMSTETDMLMMLNGFLIPGVSVFQGEAGLDSLFSIEGLLDLKDSVINGEIL